MKNISQDEYNSIMEEKIRLEKRCFILRQRLGIKTKLSHGQKLPRHIWQSPYYEELLEKKEKLAELNKKVHGMSKHFPKETTFSARFTERVKELHSDIFEEIVQKLEAENQ